MSEVKSVKLETQFEMVYVLGTLTESSCLLIQVYDYFIGDSLATNFIEIPMSEERAIKCLEEIRECITEDSIKNLWLKWVVKQYGFEKDAGNVKHFDEFIKNFQDYLNARYGENLLTQE